jgi:hypothetical protein
MKTVHLTLAAAALLATSGSAVAQSATDARCILLANAFAGQSTDAKQQKVAEDTLYYYLGRIAGTPTAAQMKAALDQQGKTITDANAGPLMNDCVKPVLAKVEVLQSLSTESKPTPQAKPAPQAQPPAQPEGR